MGFGATIGLSFGSVVGCIIGLRLTRLSQRTLQRHELGSRDFQAEFFIYLFIYLFQNVQLLSVCAQR